MTATEAPDELVRRMYDEFTMFGEIQENGMSLLKEVTVSLDGFRVTIRPNESQHRGRPHCLIAMGEFSATFDIVTGALLAGSLKSWTRTAEKVVKRNSVDLLKVWNDTRPDDQKIAPK
jgi:hypothetical protein